MALLEKYLKIVDMEIDTGYMNEKNLHYLFETKNYFWIPH